jgi:RNA-directed DNA polymerase
MKRYGYLFDKMIETQNIAQAISAAAKGKSHYNEVQVIMQNPLAYTYKIHEMLASDSFVNSSYSIFERWTGRKWRTIYKLPFYPDRIIHHCIVQVLEPIWMKHFISNTFSTIKGRGVHDGLYKLKNDLKAYPKATEYCLKMDVRKFYESVDHQVLKNLLRAKVKDERLMKLTDNIIDSSEGIPIGNYLSQWLGNYYLSAFDHYVKEVLMVKFYYRYCDDLVLLSDNKSVLHEWRKKITDYLTSHLKLDVKSNYQVFPVAARGIDFLGYRCFHGYTLIRKSILQDFKKKLRLNRSNLQQSKSSYYGWFVHANSYRLLNKYFKDEKYVRLTA